MFTIAAFLGGVAPVLDATSHFHVQYFAGLLLVAGAMGALRRWRMCGVFGAFAALNLFQFLPLFWGGGPGSEASTGPGELTLMSINVERSNRDFGRVVRLIERRRPDAFALLEADRDWIDAMEPLEATYPHSHREPRDHNFGIAFFSRLPLREVQAVRLVPEGVLSIIAEMDFDGRALTVLATHPIPPRLWSAKERNLQLAALAERARIRTNPLVILGDLNTTPWNRHFRSLVRDGGLLDSAKGFGLQPTWPASWSVKARRKLGAEAKAAGPVWSFGNSLFRIPIDHCLHSDELVTVGRAVGGDVGSDHLPLLVRLRFRMDNGGIAAKTSGL